MRLPYDGGTVCKHIVAVLLAIAQGEYKKQKSEKKRKPVEKRVSLEALVNVASKQTLARLVLDYAAIDEVFCDSAFFALGAFEKDELTKAKALIKASIRRNTQRGFIGYRECDNICRDMERVLDRAERRLEAAQPEAALALACCVLMNGVKLTSEADSSSGALSDVVDGAYSLVGRSIKALTSYPAKVKKKALDSL